MASTSENEIKSWLNVILKSEPVKDISVKLQGNSEKGDGYMGDIVFVIAAVTMNDESAKKYDLVLKCSKQSQVLRENSPVKEVFLKEIFMYQDVLSSFNQYQIEKGVKDLFNSVPKCYGSFTDENTEVIVLENMKSVGYELWPKTKALPRKHITLVVTEYGKYHATSFAFENQRPAEFKKFVDTTTNLTKNFTSDMQKIFGPSIDQACDVLKNDLDNNVLSRWKGLKNQIGTIFEDLASFSGVKVISHGDCWNNNFMYLHEEGEEKIPLKVVFLDWQLSKYASPIMDLSYFLFCCLSKEDFEVLDDILFLYHTSFENHLLQLGIEKPAALYPFKQFLSDWNKICKYGLLMASLLMKIVCKDKDEVVDIAEAAESGKEFGQSLLSDVRNKENFKRRVRPIVEYAAKHNLI